MSTRIPTFCEASVKLGHETAGCVEYEGHEGPHNCQWGAWPPCPTCGGLDEHTETCSTPYKVEARWRPAYVEWEDGGRPWVGGRRRPRQEAS